MYDYHQMVHYISDKYGVKTNGYYGPEPEKEYRNFWHWVLDHSNICNDSFGYFPDDWDTDDEEYSPTWVRKIMSLIVKEFYPNEDDDLKFWVSW